MKPLTLAEYKDFWSRFKLLEDLVKQIVVAKEGVACWFEGIDTDGDIQYAYNDLHGGRGLVECYLKPELLFAEDPLSAVEAEKAKKKEEEETRKELEKEAQDERNEKQDRIEYERLKKKFA